MPNVPRFPGLAVFLLAGLVAGCSSTRPPEDLAESQAGSSRPNRTPVLSPEALERRAEAHAHYAAAVAHDWNEDFDLAKKEYAEAAKLDPGNEEVVLEASTRLLQLRDSDGAYALLTNAAARPNASGLIFAQLGRFEFMRGKKEAALEASRTALRKAPRLISPYRTLAQIYLQERQYNEALKLLDGAMKLPDLGAAFLVELGEIYNAFIPAQTGQNVKARSLAAFKRAAELKSDNVVLLQALADNLAMLGESEQAEAIYLELLERAPALPGLREKLAGLYIRKQERDKAAAQLRAVLGETPGNARANFLMGSLAFEEKKYSEAQEYFRKTIQLNPDFEPVYYDMAAVQLSQKEPRAALGTLKRARDRFKQSFVGEFYSAMACGQLKEYTNVISHLTEAEVIARGSDETNRLNHLFYFQFGTAYERNQQFGEAEKYLRKALAMVPDFDEALNYLGYMYAEKGTNLAEAREMIEKALKKEPKNAAYLDSLGWVFFRLGNQQNALKYLLQAVENSEEPDSTIHDHLGDVYLAMGKTDAAREAWRKALSLEPNNESIKKKLGDAPVTSAPK